MSFDIFFQPCRFGRTPIETWDQFTGKSRPVFPNEPLTASELQAVQAVLDKAAVHRPDNTACHAVRVEDGGRAEVFARDLGNGCMVAVRGITPGLLGFLLELLTAGNWSMIPTMEDTVAIVPSLEAVKSVPDDFPTTIVCNSADELGVLLSGGFSAWKRYRDLVSGDG
jgi:hypothetical protein